MSAWIKRLALCALLAASRYGVAEVPAQTTGIAGAGSVAPASAWQPNRRILLSATGETLSGTRGGGGTLGYFDQLSQSALLGIAADYQSLAGSNWAFGSINTSYRRPFAGNKSWQVHTDLHEGAGRSGSLRWGYSVVAAGGGITFPGGLNVDAEDRQIDVETTHGNLPKIGLTESWSPHWVTSLGYARSFRGNLDTEYGLARIDFYGRGYNLLLGSSYGRVSPVILSINGGVTAFARHLTEVFGGVGKTFRGLDISLLADQANLAGTGRFTLTVSVTIPL